MKTHAIKYIDYLMNYDNEKLHPKLSKILDNMPKNFNEINHTIFYGPPGIGKYTTSLSMIREFSETKLNYEKKISISTNSEAYFIKISDIHYEIDCSLLGCNSKTLWNDIYKNIIDIILIKNIPKGIILCKNFQNITSDLLEIFFSYMQTLLITNINIKFILLTESISFIPENIINRCQIIHMKRPARTTYNTCIKKKISKVIDLSNITNIKMLQTFKNIDFLDYTFLCDKIISNIVDIQSTTISKLRDNLYNILIYNLNIYDCVWYIINELCNKNLIKEKFISNLVIETYRFFLYFNNNYRPIYHLENYTIYIINNIYGYGKSL